MRGGERGVYHKGRAYIAAGSHRTASGIVQTALHEIGEHHGLEAMLGKEKYAQLARRVETLRKAGNPAVKAAWAEVERQESYRPSSRMFMAEVIARVGQDQRVQKMAWWRELLDAIRAFVIKHYSIPAGKLTEDHVKTLLRAALAKSARQAIAESERRAGNARALARAIDGEVPQFHLAYHGSPHDFDAFSTAHVGSGEGAQAYGWGLYFAGKREVAEHYRKTLSRRQGTPTFLKDGKELTAAWEIAKAYYQPGTIVDGYGGKDIVLDFEREGNGYGWSVKVQSVDSAGKPLEHERARWHGTFPDMKALEKSLKAQGYEVRHGRLYEVELAPKEEDYLDWDKPLSEQSEKVQAAIKDAFDDLVNRETDYHKASELSRQLDSANTGSMTGERIYKKLAAASDTREAIDPRGDEAASRYLKSLGIPGIKYLDGSSRGAGEGHHNYVIFDEADVAVRAKFARGARQSFKTGEPTAVTAYHGSPDPGVKFEDGRPAFFTDNPELANGYTTERGLWRTAPRDGATVYRATLRMQNPLVIDARGARSDNIPVPWQEWKPKVFGNLPKNAVGMSDLVTKARADGHDGLIVQNVIDTAYTDDKEKSTVYVVYSPGQITDGVGGGVQFSRGADPAPVWFSALARAVGGAKQEVAPAAQWKAWLKNQPGVKADEIEWSGVNEWLDTQGPKVTKAVLLDYLRGNGVKVDEVELGSTDDFDDLANDEDNPDGPEAENVDGRMVVDNTKFSSYQLPGGTNYRELLLTLPAQDAAERVRLVQEIARVERDSAALVAPGGRKPIITDEARFEELTKERDRLMAQLRSAPDRDFNSSHFDTPNIVAHVRFNERTDAEGRRILFLEEIQSDWAQKGKREGFGAPEKFTPTVGVNERDNLISLMRKEAQDKAMAAGVDALDAKRLADRMGHVDLADMTGRKAEYDDLVAREQADLAAERRSKRAGTPAAPFVGKTEAWVGLALKRMIRYAVDNGFDGIAWTTGEQQADRYDLSKKVDTLSYVKREDGYRIDVIPAGRRSEWSNLGVFGEKDLPDAVGKDVADRIIRGDGEKQRDGTKYLTGLDLKVGGGGMAAFYDRIVPNVANDLLKKMGGGRVGEIALDNTEGANFKVWLPDIEEFHNRTFRYLSEAQDFAVGVGGQVKAPNGETLSQPGFYLTPAMKEKAAEGMPMFSRAKDDKTIAGRVAQLRGGGGKITDRLTDMVVSDKSFNFWHKSVGTQYHKAMVNAEFRRVFKKGQDYLHEFSRAALDAADQAPTLLPKLEGFRDIPRSIFAGAAKKDVQAAGRAILEGTLYDESADPFKGRVFSDAELADMGLTDKQASLYREARAAIDASLDLLHASEVAMLARKRDREPG